MAIKLFERVDSGRGLFHMLVVIIVFFLLLFEFGKLRF